MALAGVLTISVLKKIPKSQRLDAIRHLMLALAGSFPGEFVAVLNEIQEGVEADLAERETRH